MVRTSCAIMTVASAHSGKWVDPIAVAVSSANCGRNYLASMAAHKAIGDARDAGPTPRVGAIDISRAAFTPNERRQQRAQIAVQRGLATRAANDFPSDAIER